MDRRVLARPVQMRIWNRCVPERQVVPHRAAELLVDAGVVDEDVQPPESGYGVRHGVIHGSAVGHV